MLNRPTIVSKQVHTTLFSVEFTRDTGRLRILENGNVIAEWFPPNSWFAIASVAGRSSWGTRPAERDLGLLLDDFLWQRLGTRDCVAPDPSPDGVT